MQLLEARKDHRVTQFANASAEAALDIAMKKVLFLGCANVMAGRCLFGTKCVVGRYGPWSVEGNTCGLMTTSGSRSRLLLPALSRSGAGAWYYSGAIWGNKGAGFGGVSF